MYVLIDGDLALHEERIELQERLFLRINERYASHDKVPISVVDESGTVCFNAGWERERYSLPGGKEIGGNRTELPYFCNFSGEDLCAEEELLDFTFIESLDTLWFDLINEYSWQIIRLINRRYPDKTLITSDERVKFFPDIKVRLEDKPQSGPGSAFFVRGNVLPSQPDHYPIYSLMISLTWAKVRHGAGEKTILVIDPATGTDGLGDVVRKVSAYVALARVHGWEPVVRLNHETWLADFEGEDVWSRHFLPVGNATAADIDAIDSPISVKGAPDANIAPQYISVFENRPHEIFGRVNPYIWMFSSLYDDCTFDLKLNEREKERVLAKIPDELKDGQHVLGVLIRASDRDVVFGTKTDIERILDRTGELFCEGGYDRIFVATEETAMLEAARERFGNLVLNVDQHRVESDDEDKDQLLAQRLGRRYASKADLVTDYLAVISALSFCETVYVNRIYCGPTFLLKALANDISGRMPKILPKVYKSGDYLIQCDIEKLRATVKPKEPVVIYGAGKNGLKLRELLSPVTDNITFCDKRAEEGAFTLNGYKVISPVELAGAYNGELVVISPFGFFEQIRADLIARGIPADRIYE